MVTAFCIILSRTTICVSRPGQHTSPCEARAPRRRHGQEKQNHIFSAAEVSQFIHRQPKSLAVETHKEEILLLFATGLSLGRAMLSTIASQHFTQQCCRRAWGRLVPSHEGAQGSAACSARVSSFTSSSNLKLISRFISLSLFLSSDARGDNLGIALTLSSARILDSYRGRTFPAAPAKKLFINL